MNPYKGGDSGCAVKIGKEIIFSGGYADAYDDDGYRIMENTTIYTNDGETFATNAFSIGIPLHGCP